MRFYYPEKKKKSLPQALLLVYLPVNDSRFVVQRISLANRAVFTVALHLV